MKKWDINVILVENLWVRYVILAEKVWVRYAKLVENCELGIKIKGFSLFDVIGITFKNLHTWTFTVLSQNSNSYSISYVPICIPKLDIFVIWAQMLSFKRVQTEILGTLMTDWFLISMRDLINLYL